MKFDHGVVACYVMLCVTAGALCGAGFVDSPSEVQGFAAVSLGAAVCAGLFLFMFRRTK